MFRLFSNLIIIGLIVGVACVENSEYNDNSGENVSTSSLLEKITERNVEENTSEIALRVMEDIELSIALAEKELTEKSFTKDKKKKVYNDIIDKIAKFTDLCEDKTNVHAVLKAKCLKRLVIPNLTLSVSKLRNKLLILLKMFFTKAPAVTKNAITPKTVEKLLKIFSKDSQRDNKVLIIDIFRLWLPQNPIIQERLIKRKGLETLYNELPKLNMTIVEDMLVLLNVILKEHNSVKNNNVDVKTVERYKNVGFFDKLATPTFCDGLLQLLHVYWSMKSGNSVEEIIELMRNVKPFCLPRYKGEKAAAMLIDYMRDYLSEAEDSNDAELDKIQQILDEYSVVNVKDEF